VRDGQQSKDGPFFFSPRLLERSHSRLVLIVAGLTALISMTVCAVAILVPAPPMAVPLIVTICVGCPLFAAWEAPMALAVLRADRLGRTALSSLRRGLEQLPEVEHPLGF